MRGPLCFIITATLGLQGMAACGVKLPNATVVAEGDFPCEDSTDCPAADSPCLLSQCYDGQCVFVPSPPGQLPDEDQVAGDCKMLECDGDGGTTSVPARSDVPSDDNNPCTEARCDLDLPKQGAKEAGTACKRQGNESGVCNGAGKCGVCIPGETRCEGQATTACSNDGQWREPKPCNISAPVCADAACRAVVELAAAEQHLCARFDDGHVRCWGQTPAGGTTPPFLSAGDRLDIGQRHACRLRGGELACWGANDFGQLGNGSYASSATPVVALRDARAVAVGRDHTCALTHAGKVLCWGRNDRGQLGSGKASKPPPPSAGHGFSGPPPPTTPRVIAGVRARSIQLSGGASCFATASGELCHGLPPFALPPALDPPEGEKPDNATKKLIEERNKISIPTPTPVALEGATQIASGSHTSCARTASGTVQCWGAGDRGQLGKGSRDSFRPSVVPSVTDALTVQLGDDFACATLSGGALRCWGANGSGQLGRGTTEPAGAPAPVPGLAAEQLAVAASAACALTSDKRVLCWGDGMRGAIGNGKLESAPSATPVQW